MDAPSDASKYRPARIAAGSLFVGLTVCALTRTGPGPLCAAGMAASAAAFAWITHRMNRVRTMGIYGLLARIGEGDLAAALPDSTDELTLRLQRGVARAQRGFAEALARAELERDDLQALLGAIQTGCIALDRHLRIHAANEVAERMLGLQSSDYRGRLLAEVIRQPELLAFAERACASQGPVTAEIRLTGQGTESVQVAGDQLAGGGLLLALDDVTRLRRLEHVRSDFAANVSHELRTPITNIQGYIETLLDIGTEDPAQVRHFLGVIHQNTLRLSTLIEDILLLAFLEQPRTAHTLDFQTHRLCDLVLDACTQLEAMAKARGIELDMRVPPELHAPVNASLVTQALLNLLSNALKYAPEGKSVRIEGTLVDGSAELQVIDQGPGIPAEHRERLFERFYRIDSARSRDAGGTGLGLAIVKHIALVHGGSASVDCPEGGGTAFLLRVPRGFLQTNAI